MTTKKEDRRVQRTRSLLYDALIDLMIHKGYEPITIQDIIDRANVGRSTFYSHFEDKEQLLISCIAQLGEFLKEQVELRTASIEKGAFRFGFSLAMFQHVQSHKRIYRATVGKQSGVLVLHHVQRMLLELAREEVDSFIADANHLPLPQEIVVEFVVQTFMTLVTWWMDKNMPCSAEELDLMFHQLILSGIGSPEIKIPTG